MKIFNLKLLYLYKFISQCLPIYAFYTILFLQRGLSPAEVALLIALWSAFAIAFELPSGVLADRWNRRNMLCLSAMLQGLCFVVWFFAQGFPLFAAGFVLWGLSGAFASGTEEGLIYDNLKFDGREEDFAKVYGRAQFFASAGSLVGIASAGVLAHAISLSAMALLSAAICLANAGLALFLREKNYYAEKEAKAEKTEREAGGFFSTFKEAGTFLRRSRLALAAVLFLVFFASLASYLDEFDALIVIDFALDPLWVSAILALRFLFVALGNFLAPKLQKKLPSIGKIFLSGVLACAFLAAFALWWNQYAILCFGLFAMGQTLNEVLLVDAIQAEIREEGRATVMSFYGVLQNVVMIAFSLFYGLMVGLLPLQMLYLILALYGILGGLAFFFIFKRVK